MLLNIDYFIVRFRNIDHFQDTRSVDECKEVCNTHSFLESILVFIPNVISPLNFL